MRAAFYKEISIKAGSLFQLVTDFSFVIALNSLEYFRLPPDSITLSGMVLHGVLHPNLVLWNLIWLNKEFVPIKSIPKISKYNLTVIYSQNLQVLSDSDYFSSHDCLVG